MDSKKHDKNESNLKTRNDLSDLLQFEEQFNFSPQTEQVLNASLSQQALENIKHIFDKTRTIREVADGKHQVIQDQFKQLRERLNASSESLQRMKNGIDNIKFSYQKKVYEMHQSLGPSGLESPIEMPRTKEDVAKRMEEIKDKIEKIQLHVRAEKEKHETVVKNYQEAFENVAAALNNIDKGDYSSLDVGNYYCDK